jgi:putative hemolysin
VKSTSCGRALTTTAVATLRPDLGLIPAIAQGAYRLRLAADQGECEAAFRLRFMVFNLELNEGLEPAYLSGLDTDEFDAFCDHLVVEHAPTGQIVGTYRLQTGPTAAANCGYYSAREFDFAPYEPLRNQIVELGRACIHRNHRSTEVLYLLWRGIAAYAVGCGCRYLIGCSSLTSQDGQHGMAAYEYLRDYLVEEALRTEPTPPFQISVSGIPPSNIEIPKLLRTYLAIGAKICGPPAIDREFKTIDFLTLLDMQSLHPRIRSRFLPKL